MTRRVGFGRSSTKSEPDPQFEWQQYLDRREKIMWQGRPDGQFQFRPAHIVTFIFGLGFAGFALFWMVMAARAGGVFWMFGLIHFLVGVGIAVVPPFWTTFRRRRTWYALTDRRAFVATDLPLRGRRLKSYPITSEAVLDFNNEEPATIYFAQQTRRGKNRTYQVNIGFERIADGPEVYQLMRGIQEAAQ